MLTSSSLTGILSLPGWYFNYPLIEHRACVPVHQGRSYWYGTQDPLSKGLKAPVPLLLSRELELAALMLPVVCFAVVGSRGFSGTESVRSRSSLHELNVPADLA